MNYDILLTRETETKYKAQALLFPHIEVTGATEAVAIAEIKKAIQQMQRQSRIVRVDIPTETALMTQVLPITAEDPWAQVAGIWQDDPDWEQFQEEIGRYRTAQDGGLS